MFAYVFNVVFMAKIHRFKVIFVLQCFEFLKNFFNENFKNKLFLTIVLKFNGKLQFTLILSRKQTKTNLQ